MNDARNVQIQQRLQQLTPVQDLLQEAAPEEIIQDLRTRLIESELDLESLRSQYYRKQQIFQHTPLAGAVFDREMNYLAVNRRWMLDHRPPVADLVGRNHYDISLEVSDEWRHIHQRCLQGEINVAERAPFVRPDGTTDWMRWDIRPWYELNGDIGGLLMFTEFTTPVVQIEEEAQLYWERYQQLFAAAPVGMAFLRQDGSIVQANTAFAVMFSYQPEDVPDLSLTELAAQDDFELCLENMRAVFTDQIASFSIERIFRGQDGEFVWTNFTAIPVRDASGKVLYLLGMFEDITEQKAMLTELQNSEARYRSVVEGQTDLICRYTPDFTLTFVNDAYAAMMKEERRALLGQNLLSKIAPDDIEQAQKRVLEISPDNPITISEHRTLLPDGSARWFQWKDSAIFDNDGSILEYQGVGRDITERKLIEEALYFVAQRGWAVMENTFFDALVNYLSQIFNLSYVFIGQLVQPESNQIQTISFSEDGALRTNILYNLEGAPCQNVVGHTLCCYPTGVQSLFPEDKGLVRLGIDGYMGIPLWDSSDKPLGIIVIMDRKPLENIAVLESVLQIVAVRAAHELEQMMTKKALQESETRYRMVVDTLAEGVFMLDQQGNTLAWNNRAVELLLLDSAVFQVFMTQHPPHIQYLDEAGSPIPPEQFPAVHALRTGQAHTDHVIGIRYPDEVRWFMFNTQPLFQDGEVIPYAVVCSFSDVTAERLAQERILDSEKRFRTLFENAPLAILQTDTDGKIRTANNMAVQLSGYSLEELKHLPITTLIPDWMPLRPRQETAHSSAALSESEDAPQLLLHADRSMIPVELASSQIQDHGRNSDILFLNDIRSRLREEQERHKAELLSIELDKERELRELKTRFITMVSHEFRTPMAIIMTSTAYVRRKMEENIIVAQRLDRIDEQIKRLAHLIDDVTTLNKWDLIPIEVRRDQINLRHFLEQVNDEMLLIYPQRNPDLQMNYSGDTEVLTDEALLYQIYGNLLTNALKYSREGEVVQVHCVVDKAHLHLTVSDQGIGIPPEDHPYLFESFRRASNVDMVSGTGLGLAIVKRATDALGGTVTFTSELDQGTTFDIRLPLVDSALN